MGTRLGGALVAEFVGSFALTFTGIMAICFLGGTTGGLIGIALAHGIILAVMVTATMPTSGGHLNPAVTLGFLLTKKIKPVGAIAYIVIQLLGGLAASLAVCGIFGFEHGAKVVLGGTPNIGSGFTPTAALLAEIIATFFLVFVIWGTAADPRAKAVGGFAIGLTIAADILAVGSVSGASMNPQRSFGPALIGSMSENGGAIWANHWIYWVGPIIGACLAASVYHLALWPKDQRTGAEAPAKDVPASQRPA